MSAHAAVRIIWILGGLALLLAALRPGRPVPPAIGLVGSDRSWVEGGFKPGAAYPTTTQNLLPANTATVGSWLDGDEWRGEAATGWIPCSVPSVRIYVAGYPQHDGCRLWAEFRDADGSIRRVDCPLANAHETWMPWDLDVPESAVAMRILAEDHAVDPAGWLAFSEPVDKPSEVWPAFYMFAQGVTTFALALTLIWGPGLLWSPHVPADCRLIALLGCGPLAMAATGLLVWLLAGVLPPTFLGAGLVFGWWILIGRGLWRRSGSTAPLSPSARGVLALGALVAASGAAKAGYSGGPEGELFAGTRYRTLAVGDRPDSRISYHTVQAAAHHLAPASAQTETFFTPWTFFSRGPLAGLIALPISLATAGMPPRDIELYAWEPFDRAGFAAYRIVLMVLASTVVVALFAVIVPLAGETWAIVGAGLLALSPFGMHEILFTWPKFAATAGLLASFALAQQRRPFAAGLATGVGFLFHPMAALWAPWLMLWAVVRRGPGVGACASGGWRYTAGTSIVILPWLAAGTVPPQLPDSIHAGTGSFMQYFAMAEYQPATWESWLRTRWASFSNTHLPFWLHLFNRDHPVLNSVDAPSGPLVKFAFGWWNTLPLGMGLGLWAIASLKLFMMFRQLAVPLLLFVVGPTLLLTAYWGASTTGLMRECGHPVFAAMMALFCVACVKAPGRLTRLVLHPIVPWLQLPETLLMLWLTTLLNRRQPGTGFDWLDPIHLMLNIGTLGLAAWLLSHFRRVSRDRAPAP